MRNGASSMSLARTNLYAKHANISVTSPDGTVIFVDEALGHLLPALWSQGYQTVFSCGGGQPTNENYLERDMDLYGYIYFEQEDDAVRFMQAAEDRFPPSVYPYFLETNGGITNCIVRFEPRMVSLFEDLFQPTGFELPESPKQEKVGI